MTTKKAAEGLIARLSMQKLATAMVRETDVGNCARCGQNHSKLLFKELTQAADEWQWWAACPTNGEPIMLKVDEGPKTEDGSDGD